MLYKIELKNMKREKNKLKIKKLSFITHGI